MRTMASSKYTVARYSMPEEATVNEEATDPDAPANKETIQRLRRIEGQIRGIQRMIDEGRACDEVMAQLLAARAALDQVATHVVVTHIDECLATLPPDRARVAVSRAIKMLGKVQS